MGRLESDMVDRPARDESRLSRAPLNGAILVASDETERIFAKSLPSPPPDHRQEKPPGDLPKFQLLTGDLTF